MQVKSKTLHLTFGSFEAHVQLDERGRPYLIEHMSPQTDDPPVCSILQEVRWEHLCQLVSAVREAINYGQPFPYTLDDSQLGLRCDPDLGFAPDDERRARIDAEVQAKLDHSEPNPVPLTDEGGAR